MKKGPEDDRPEVVFGMHPVLEAIEAGTRSIDRILVAREGGGHNLGRLLRAAREAGIPVTHLPREVLARKVGARAVHQGVAAQMSPVAYALPESIIAAAAADPRGLLLLLDGIEDPRNLGAIVRTAAAAGVHGILLGTEDTVGLTPAAAKTAAGALERIPVAREPKLRRRVESLREAGFRTIALDARGPTPWDEEAFEGRVAVLAGGEGKGLRRVLLEAADARVSLPLAAGVASLNVSVAVGAVLFEILRRRRARAKGAASARNPHASP